MANIDDRWFLGRYRKSQIIVCVGQGAWEHEAIEDTRTLDILFQEKAIPAWVDYWGYDVNHDWPWWFRQMNFFLGHLYG
jgi:esterase/lipase superfamily enzyme